MVDSAPSTFPAWWGSVTLDVGAAGHWLIGPFALWARRTQHEWRIAFDSDGDLSSAGVSTEIPTAREGLGENAMLRRFAFKETHAELRILPALADRPVVVKPSDRFLIPPREEVTLYVSTPLWVTVQLGKPPTQVLDTPCFRPSDTWFGPNTRVGELCYAARTHAEQELERVRLLPYRTISVVRIRNRAPSRLEFERVKLPVPHLSLFADASNRLWTESLTLDRDADGEFADLVLGKGAPAEARGAKVLAGPREHYQKGLSMRVFGHLLH